MTANAGRAEAKSMTDEFVLGAKRRTQAVRARREAKMRGTALIATHASAEKVSTTPTTRPSSYGSASRGVGAGPQCCSGRCSDSFDSETPLSAAAANGLHNRQEEAENSAAETFRRTRAKAQDSSAARKRTRTSLRSQGNFPTGRV